MAFGILLSAAVAVFSARAFAAEPADLGFLAGAWTIHDADGAEVGSSEIVEQAAGAVYFETRRVGDTNDQPLWFVNSESAGGWSQLFVGPGRRVRAFEPISAPGEWPIVLGATLVMKDGAPAQFRMTLARTGEDRSRRALERSNDGGATWTTVFDYDYRRRK